MESTTSQPWSSRSSDEQGESTWSRDKTLFFLILIRASISSCFLFSVCINHILRKPSKKQNKKTDEVAIAITEGKEGFKQWQVFHVSPGAGTRREVNSTMRRVPAAILSQIRSISIFFATEYQYQGFQAAHQAWEEVFSIQFWNGSTYRWCKYMW